MPWRSITPIYDRHLGAGGRATTGGTIVGPYGTSDPSGRSVPIRQVPTNLRGSANTPSYDFGPSPTGSGPYGPTTHTTTPTGTGAGTGTGTAADVFSQPDVPSFSVSGGGHGGSSGLSALADIIRQQEEARAAAEARAREEAERRRREMEAALASLRGEIPDYSQLAPIDVPDFVWAPTEEQLGGWQEEAAKRAGLVYDPQIEEVARGLERFRGVIDEERPRVGREMDERNLAIANVIANTMRGPITESAIRRGATESGELPRQMQQAGRMETQQRAEVERQRGTALDSLRDALMQQEREAADMRSQLEGLRGQKQEIRYADLERQARERQMQEMEAAFGAAMAHRRQRAGELESVFGGHLSTTQLQHAEVARQAEAEWRRKQAAEQARVNAWQQNFGLSQFEAQRAQQAWERQFAEQQFGYQQAQDQWRRAQASRPDPGRTFAQQQAETRWQWEQEDRRQQQEINDMISGLLSGTSGTRDPFANVRSSVWAGPGNLRLR